MRKFYLVSLIFCVAATLACSKVEESNKMVEMPNEGVAIGLPVEVSRTAFNGESASWVVGDTFTLWAKNDSGQRIIKAAPFEMMYYWDSYKSAVFTSQQGPIAEGIYTYYAVSPTPTTYDNNLYTATYTIPAEQQGDSFNGEYDIMVAEPVTEAAALVSEEVNDLKLDFHHKMHILKVTIAENNLGVDIKQLRFTFPTSVVGDVALNAVTGDITTSNGGKALNISTSNGVNVGESVWGTILPGEISGDVKVVAVGSDGRLSIEKTFSLSKSCEEGHITPLLLTVPVERTTLRFSIGANNLGEKIEKLTITDHAGKNFVFATNDDNRYDYAVENASTNAFDHYKGKTFTATFESAHAIVKSTFTMPTSFTSGVNVIPAITVPYLFFEDFTSIHTSFEKDDKRVDNLRSADGMLLNNYMSVSGWNGAHIKGVAGKSVRVNTRHQSFMGATRTNGRLDSPAMKNLKSGANVKLKVVFDMGAYANSGYGKDNDIFCIVGMHTEEEGRVLNGLSATTVAGEDINDDARVPSMFSSVCLQTGYITQTCGDNSFGASLPTYTFTTAGCTSATRFGWAPCCVQQNWGSGNAHYYIYIDNIKVSIAQ